MGSACLGPAGSHSRPVLVSATTIKATGSSGATGRTVRDTGRPSSVALKAIGARPVTGARPMGGSARSKTCT